MMTRGAKVLRNSLIFLALSAATASLGVAAEVPLGSSANAPGPAVQLNVPIGSASTPPTPQLLNLKAPDIHDVMTPGEIEAAMPPDEQEMLGPETVDVQGEVPAPYVPMGFAALYWAAYHPMDSWRILAPVQ
jgi:hypothetical protein